VVEAYVKGNSTRKVDDLVKALGIEGTCARRSRGSARCSMRRCGRSSVTRSTPSVLYLWLDATFHKVREVGRFVSVATVVAIG
jgi:transposase-like protein